MRIERFAAEDMSGAIRLVKARFGPEAVILDNDRIGNRVEVLAACDYDESLLTPMPENIRPAVELLSLQDDLRDLKDSLADELSQIRSSRESDHQSYCALVGQRLEYLGFSQDVISQVRAKVSPQEKPSWSTTMNLLGTTMATGKDEILKHGGVVALLGATGVGKTTTAAKLAAQFAFRHGREQVALITTDSFRVGGHEQLGSYAKTLGIPMEVACDKRTLAETVNKFKSRKLVLIDTAGMSQRDVHLSHHLLNIVGGAPGLKGYLVLSSTSQLGIAHEVADAFGKIPLQAAIITKTDEAMSLGPVLSGAIRAKLPVAYICNGQGVPEDIEIATKRSLLALTRGLVDDNQRLSRLFDPRGELHG